MKKIREIILEDHDWEVERRSYMEKSVCKQCGIIRHTTWDPGWPSVDSFFSEDGSEIRTSMYERPKCRLSYDKYLEKVGNDGSI